MAVLLIAEINDGTLAMDATAKAVAAAAPLGDVTVLAVGATAKDAAAEAATIEGVSKVLVAEDARYGHRLAELHRNGHVLKNIRTITIARCDRINREQDSGLGC